MPVISVTSVAWARMSPINRAFCSPVEASRAGMFRRIDHLQIGEMRAVERAAGGGITRATIAQDLR